MDPDWTPRSFHVPEDALYAFVRSVLAGGTDHLLLSSGDARFRVTRVRPARPYAGESAEPDQGGR